MTHPLCETLSFPCQITLILTTLLGILLNCWPCLRVLCWHGTTLETKSGHLIGCGKNLKIMRKFSAILCGRKWRLCGKDARLCGNFYNLITLLPWLFPTYKTHVNVLPIILVLYDPFDLLLPFVDTYMYFFVQRNFSMVFEGFRCCVCPKLSNQALIRTRKTGHH